MTAVLSYPDASSTFRILRPKDLECLRGVLQRSNLTSSTSRQMTSTRSLDAHDNGLQKLVASACNPCRDRYRSPAPQSGER